jgi:hypothetical protein
VPTLRRHLLALFACLCASAFLAPAAAFGATGSGGLAPSSGSPSSGDSDSDAPASDSDAPAAEEPSSTGRVAKARIVRGKAVAPASAPAQVKSVIAAANAISAMPYRYGGGHSPTFQDTGYDCSGAVSYALRGGGLLNSPLASGPFMSWGAPGTGKWITTYAHSGHMYMMVAGLRFDTGFRDSKAAARGIAPGRGPRWGYARSTAGFTPRHPAGL